MCRVNERERASRAQQLHYATNKLSICVFVSTSILIIEMGWYIRMVRFCHSKALNSVAELFDRQLVLW